MKTSNPSSGEFQDQLVDGKPLYELVAEKVAMWGESHMGDSYSYVGAVVGATYPKMGEVLRKIMPKNYILVPGYGAQEEKQRTSNRSLMRTDWEPSSIPPEASSVRTNRNSTPDSEPKIMRMHPDRLCWI